MNICIYASDLSVITGHNTFKNENEIILKLWKNNFPEDYSEILSKLYLEDDVNINLVQETSDDYIKRISETYNIKDLNKNIEQCHNSKNISELNKSKSQLLNSVKNIPKKEKNILKECLTSKVNTSFGTKNENKGLQKYIQTTHEQVKTIHRFFKKDLFKTKQYNWSIGGKIDGIDNDETTIIEIKNRVHKLFYKLRDYEKVQIFAYMFMLNKKKSKLVECFQNDNDCDINIINVEFDDIYWENEIETKIIAFIKKFQKFLKNDSLKKKLLLDI